MVQKRKRKRNVKMMGKRTFGYGSHKKHRGGGSRGGRGVAGMKKHRKTWMIKNEPDHLGKRGFRSLEQRNFRPSKKAVNVGDLVKLAAGKKDIDLSALGYAKVLGGGSIGVPLAVKAGYFTKKAREKIEGAKGKAVSLAEAE